MVLKHKYPWYFLVWDFETSGLAKYLLYLCLLVLSKVWGVSRVSETGGQTRTKVFLANAFLSPPALYTC